MDLVRILRRSNERAASGAATLLNSVLCSRAEILYGYYDGVTERAASRAAGSAQKGSADLCDLCKICGILVRFPIQIDEFAALPGTWF